MSFSIDYQEKDKDGFNIFLSEIIADSEGIERKMLRDAGNKVKERVVANLNRHRRVLAVRYKNRPAMADDVRVSVRKDKYGNLVARVGGGKMTGTLWHLVNDGNLHSTATHFMDSAIKELDNSIDGIWDGVTK